MNGYFDEYGHPRIEISVIGIRATCSIEAVIDTGFDGDLCLPIQIAIQLGMELRDILYIELADGTIKDELVFAGAINWEGETKEVRVILTSSEDALIGIGLLAEKRLEIDFGKRSINITKN